MRKVKITLAYIVLTLLFFAAIILTCIIIHLIIKGKQFKEKGKTFQFFLFTTVIGITSFLVSLILVMCIVVQIILIDGGVLHPDFYYSTFEDFEYMIVIFDSFGHIAMLTVFIIRFQICFENSIFGFSSKLKLYTYICLIVLTSMSIIISVLVITGEHNDHEHVYIIIFEIVWEILIEIMCLWLLYLFISKLYAILKIALKAYYTNGSTQKPISELSLFKDLKQNKSAYDMENIAISPAIAIKKPKQEEEQPKQKDPSMFSISSTNTGTTTSSASASKLSLNSGELVINDPTIIELVNVMNKMSLLVIVCVTSSFVTVVGNVFIEVHELETIEKHTADTQSIVDFLLPAIDTVITSFMMYLQFGFTGSVYSSMCGKLDAIFLNIWISINKYWLAKKKHHKEPENQIHETKK